VTIVGLAQSNARVSTLMRTIEGSPWLEKPALVEIKLVSLPAAPKGEPQRMNEFTLTFEIRRAAPPTTLPAAGTPAKAAAKGGKA
jgi:type IV pilus assembly protein PilN